ncbi:hypothetical protein CCMSSC00406_0006054 [Pleurotus cornucopiae]|uniref:Uncharacterized protein n=1 Tax=Pleurotus cornucopiae TaxID=5321 RepID=A0ACB7IQ45_PLECO|nr:hypothetical protein CCMSSC00406_0006054 [Pleurotus cornucopiae]
MFSIRVFATVFASGAILLVLRGAFESSNSVVQVSGGTEADGGVVGVAKVVELGTIWDQIETTPELKWTDCYTQLQCARLRVPLNYSDPKGPPASIALIRFPSPLAGTEEYKGPILLNPGGPGGSGVQLVVNAGQALSQLLGPNFDIVSFDPRGVGLSIPRASFFDTNVQRAMWGSVFDVLNATSDGLARAWGRAQLTGGLAAKHDQRHVFEHINTENTARDMLEIVEAHGRKKIQYWGFSYGTVLGATFASIFPDRIERLVLDGVVDSENYFATLWSNNLLDTDKTLQTFFDGCFEAGPIACPFYEPSPQAISRKLDDLTHHIFLNPVPVQTNISYGLVDYTLLRLTIFQSLYTPYAAFPLLGRALADLADGDGTLLYQFFEQPPFDCSCEAPAPLQPIRDGQTTILCTDGEEVRDTVKELRPFVDNLVGLSQWGEVWATIRIGCTAWPKQQKKHFRGPFVGNTSHPILWVGNTADPVTPVALAHKMAKGFPGSVVLTQDSPGHCSIAAPSSCSQRYIRDYFMHGTLPREGIVCPVDSPIFPQPQLSTSVNAESEAPQQPLGKGKGPVPSDPEMGDVLERLRKSFRVPSPLWLGI